MNEMTEVVLLEHERVKGCRIAVGGLHGQAVDGRLQGDVHFPLLEIARLGRLGEVGGRSGGLRHPDLIAHAERVGQDANGTGVGRQHVRRRESDRRDGDGAGQVVPECAQQWELALGTNACPSREVGAQRPFRKEVREEGRHPHARRADLGERFARGALERETQRVPFGVVEVARLEEERVRSPGSEVVRLARECALVKLGTVAIGGTKVKANASRHKAMSYKRMRLRGSLCRCSRRSARTSVRRPSRRSPMPATATRRCSPPWPRGTRN